MQDFRKGLTIGIRGGSGYTETRFREDLNKSKEGRVKGMRLCLFYHDIDEYIYGPGCTVVPSDR